MHFLIYFLYSFNYFTKSLPDLSTSSRPFEGANVRSSALTHQNNGNGGPSVREAYAGRALLLSAPGSLKPGIPAKSQPTSFQMGKAIGSRPHWCAAIAVNQYLSKVSVVAILAIETARLTSGGGTTKQFSLIVHPDRDAISELCFPE